MPASEEPGTLVCCLNCRWWLYPTRGDPKDPDGLCMRWHEDGCMFVIEAWYPNRQAGLLPCLEESVRLWTAPNFNCAHWEGRDG